MKTYWIRIGVVAVIVFALGMTGVTAARRGKQKLKELVTNGRLFNIPADIIPFQFEGHPIGSIRGMDLSGWETTFWRLPHWYRQ